MDPKFDRPPEHFEVRPPRALGQIDELYIALVAPGEGVQPHAAALDSKLVAWSRGAATGYGVTFGDFVWGAINEIHRGNEDPSARFESFLPATARADVESEVIDIVLPDSSYDWLVAQCEHFDVSLEAAIATCLRSRQDYCAKRYDAGSDKVVNLPEVLHRRKRFRSFASVVLDLEVGSTG